MVVNHELHAIIIREMERRAKSEQARKETEAILAAQAEEVRLRKIEMDKRDAERAKRMEIEAKERALINLEKRKKADARIQSEFSLERGEGERRVCRVCEGRSQPGAEFQTNTMLKVWV